MYPLPMFCASYVLITLLCLFQCGPPIFPSLSRSTRSCLLCLVLLSYLLRPCCPTAFAGLFVRGYFSLPSFPSLSLLADQCIVRHVFSDCCAFVLLLCALDQAYLFAVFMFNAVRSRVRFPGSCLCVTHMVGCCGANGRRVSLCSHCVRWSVRVCFPASSPAVPPHPAAYKNFSFPFSSLHGFPHSACFLFLHLVLSCFKLLYIYSAYIIYIYTAYPFSPFCNFCRRYVYCEHVAHPASECSHGTLHASTALLSMGV